eukprot:360301-Chlamydomonas_euryale.AAC.1
MGSGGTDERRRKGGEEGEGEEDKAAARDAGYEAGAERERGREQRTSNKEGGPRGQNPFPSLPRCPCSAAVQHKPTHLKTYM